MNTSSLVTKLADESKQEEVQESSREEERARELSDDEPMEVVGLRVEHPADYVTLRFGDGPAANEHAGTGCMY